MKEAMKEIEEAKQDMSVPGLNQRAAEEEAGGDEEDHVVEVRRSGRERKKDWCWKDQRHEEESNHHHHETQTLASESHSLLQLISHGAGSREIHNRENKILLRCAAISLLLQYLINNSNIVTLRNINVCLFSSH
jgi:hypothetical protein